MQLPRQGSQDWITVGKADTSPVYTSPGQKLQDNQEWVTVGKGGKPVRRAVVKQQKAKRLIKKEKKKIPNTAAISIKGNTAEFSYTDVLKRVRQNISLGELDIQSPKIRKGISGATIIEIPGPDCIKKADLLANEMQKMLSGEAKINYS